jgi:hypothetical protein
LNIKNTRKDDRKRKQQNKQKKRIKLKIHHKPSTTTSLLKVMVFSSFFSGSIQVSLGSTKSNIRAKTEKGKKRYKFSLYLVAIGLPFWLVFVVEIPKAFVVIVIGLLGIRKARSKVLCFGKIGFEISCVWGKDGSVKCVDALK